MVSQFVSSHDVRLLGQLDFDFPEGTHAIGRLDNHSEGLLLLTTNPKITRLLFQGKKPHGRTYLVQVKNKISQASIDQLCKGIEIEIKGGMAYTTSPCLVKQVERPSWLEPAAHEIPAKIPNSWLEITLTEGKFHQVRKMVAAVHHKCRRLVRTSIENLRLQPLFPGSVSEIPESDFFELLQLEKESNLD
jgi:23S rRNA pseudouridine2457 synthase